MYYNSYPDLSFFLLDSNQGGLLGNTVDPAAEFPLKKIILWIQYIELFGAGYGM